jgi:hypothetical protein
MTIFPNDIDTDLQLPRVEDGTSEFTGDSVNAVRDAVISIEETLGVNPQGTAGTVAARLDVAIDSNGDLKPAAISGLGLVTLPITNTMIAAAAGIVESKLNLDYSTAALFAAISAANSSLNGITINLSEVMTNYTKHIYGITTLDGYVNRHVASHIDINNGLLNGYPLYTGEDPRDVGYNNPGLYGLDGYVRNIDTVMKALVAINQDFVSHALSTSLVKHLADFIILDTTNFDIIPKDKDTVQSAIDYLDDLESLNFETHRGEEHSNGIPRGHRVSRQQDDGYNVFYGPYPCQTSIDVNKFGLVNFTAAPGEIDWAFRQLLPGDSITINYGGYTANFGINAITYTPGSVYQVLIDGYHLNITATAYAILQKSKYEENSFGALAVVPANHGYYTGGDSASVPGSAIVIPPNAAAVTGIDFAPEDLDDTHYLLYIAFYPTGNPADANVVPPTNIIPIDVTGNAGVTPGKYTIQTVVQTINDTFRAGGYNYRFAAFEYMGQLGIALTDTIDNAGFSIISGSGTGTTLDVGGFTNNVVGDATTPVKDPLGFGMLKANVASPSYQDPTATSLATKVVNSRKHKSYQVDGQYIDFLKKGHLTNTDGSYDGYLYDRVAAGLTRTKGVYRINQDLQNTDLRVGSTITVYPAVLRADPTFIEQDYGRFIVESLSYNCCPGDGWTDITVVTCTSLVGDPNYIASVPPPELPVKIYFGNDSVSFQNNEGDVYRNLFEVYVKKDGETLSHKRARLPIKTSGGGSELNTNTGSPSLSSNYGWHIVDVSPKFRGFFGYTSLATDLTKYIRFVITNYNIGDDSFDCYIGQPDDTVPFSGTVQNQGPIVRVRKGDVIRCYDNTNIDYIEINFTDAAYMNHLVMPSDISVPAGELRYMDIEIFDTMRLNQEFMCLAVCEQYSSGADKTSIWNIIDKRQFGNVSEKNFTSSAIKFIEASDREFRQNGVARGFAYKGMSGTNLMFDGGTAIVNGTIVNKNNFTVFPFQMYVTLPTTVTYALCLKADGTTVLIAIDLVATTTEYNLGWETIYTLGELISTRKDLLPLYVFDVITASLTVDPDIKDVRKFVVNDEARTPLTLSGTLSTFDDGEDTVEPCIETSNFMSWQAVANYIKYANLVHSKIIVRGKSTIEPVTGTTIGVDFGGKSVEIYGEPNNAVYCVYTAPFIAIALQSNITIDGVNFIRCFDTITADLPYYTNGYGNATLGLVLSEGSGSITYENIKIKNCSFNTRSTNRAAAVAHILFEETGPGSYSIIKNVQIFNNTFKETLTQLAIAFVNKAGERLADPTVYGSTSQGTILASVVIEQNRGYKDSWIMLSSDNYAVGGESSRGLVGYGVKIINNSFHHIWYNLSRYLPAGYDGTLSGFFGPSAIVDIPLMRAELEISGNSCIGIVNRAIDGTILFTSSCTKVAGPSTQITNNSCTSIFASINGDVYNDGTYDYIRGAGPVIISNNIIMASPFNFLNFLPSDTYVVQPPADKLSYAIFVAGNMAIGHEKQNLVKISDNIIGNEIKDFYSSSLTYKYNYTYPIRTTVPCSIDNNTIDSCIATELIATNYSGIYLDCIIH